MTPTITLVALCAMQAISIDTDEQGAFVQSAEDGMRLFDESGECTAESDVYQDTKYAIVVYHGISVFIIWGVLVPTGIIVVRYFRFIRAFPSRVTVGFGREKQETAPSLGRSEKVSAAPWKKGLARQRADARHANCMLCIGTASCMDIHREVMSAAVSGTWVFALMSIMYVVFHKTSIDSSSLFPHAHHKLGVALSLVLTFQVSCLLNTTLPPLRGEPLGPQAISMSQRL